MGDVTFFFYILVQSNMVCDGLLDDDDTDLVHVDGVVPGPEREEAPVWRELDDVDWLRAVLVHAEHLPRVDVENDPLAGDGADNDDLPVGGKGGGLGLLSNVVAPHHGVAQGVPQVDHSKT